MYGKIPRYVGKSRPWQCLKLVDKKRKEGEKYIHIYKGKKNSNWVE